MRSSCLRTLDRSLVQNYSSVVVLLIGCEHELSSGGHSVSSFQMGCEHELSSGYPRFAHASAALKGQACALNPRVRIRLRIQNSESSAGFGFSGRHPDKK